MSHLPPKPEFGSPSRAGYPPDYRHYGRPPPPPPPDRYRERDVYAPRSPTRYSGDSYVATRAADSYRAPRPSGDSYVATYDRRDDRYRDYWEREAPRERDWRERGYPPPDTRYTPPEPIRDRRDWERRRDERVVYDREREWRDRREYSSPRYRDSRDDERMGVRERPREDVERTWIPRASKSPPRRVAPTSSRLRSSRSPPARGRSPLSPRTRTPIRRRYSRPSSPSSPIRDRPSRLRSRSRDVRPGAQSISVSPRRVKLRRTSRDSTPRSSSSVSISGERGRERRSRSPKSVTRSRRRPSSRSLSPQSPGLRKGGTSLDRPSPPPALGALSERQRTPTTPKIPSRQGSVSAAHTAVEDSHETSPQRRDSTPAVVKLEGPEESIEAPPESAVYLSRAEEKGKMREIASALEEEVDFKMKSVSPPQKEVVQESAFSHTSRRTSRSPPAGPRNYVPTPPTPSDSSPRTPHTAPFLPQRPHRSNQPIKSSSTPRPSLREPLVAPLNEHDKKAKKMLTDNEAELLRLRPHRMHLSTKYLDISKGARRALHALEMAMIDLRAAEQRRIVADEQLQKAREGTLGIDYVPSARLRTLDTPDST